MSLSRSARPSLVQMKRLLELLCKDGILMDQGVLYRYTNRNMFWKSIANELNAVDNGVKKPYLKWCKVFADWKTKTKKKADNALKRKFTKQPNFTKLEVKLLKSMKYPIDDVLDHLNARKVNNQIPEDSNHFYEDVDPIEHNSDYNSVVIDNQDNKEFVVLEVDDLKNSSYNIFDSANNTVENETEAANITLEDPTATDNDNTLDYKFQERLALEKERTNQKNEELKLKSLELKLKADELKIKETELNKVNYLTQLEEEKLKCMVDIAASLKELVAWTKNGSSRFHNAM